MLKFLNYALRKEKRNKRKRNIFTQHVSLYNYGLQVQTLMCYMKTASMNWYA